MRSSVFASDISMLSMNVENSGHSSYALRSVARSPNDSHAEPRPYQAARLMRAWAHEKIHGIVRRSSSDLAPAALRRAGTDRQQADLGQRRDDREPWREVLAVEQIKERFM